jgi:hypothetical protein
MKSLRNTQGVFALAGLFIVGCLQDPDSKITPPDNGGPDLSSVNEPIHQAIHDGAELRVYETPGEAILVFKGSLDNPEHQTLAEELSREKTSVAETFARFTGKTYGQEVESLRALDERLRQFKGTAVKAGRTPAESSEEIGITETNGLGKSSASTAHDWNQDAQNFISQFPKPCGWATFVATNVTWAYSQKNGYDHHFGAKAASFDHGATARIGHWNSSNGNWEYPVTINLSPRQTTGTWSVTGVSGSVWRRYETTGAGGSQARIHHSHHWKDFGPGIGKVCN